MHKTLDLQALRGNTLYIGEENVLGTGLTTPQVRGLYIVPSDVPGRPDITGYFLSAENSEGKVQWVQNPFGDIALGDLSDVDTTGVMDGQVIIYQAATQTWIPGTNTGVIAGDALAFVGNVLNVQVDNTTIQINGLNELELVNDSISLTNTGGLSIVGSPVSLGNNVNIGVDATVIRTTGGQTINGSLAMDTLILNDLGANSVSLEAPGAVVASYTLVWPDAQGGAGEVLENDGAGNLSWVLPTGTPGGPNESIQYNDAGAFNGSANFTFDGTDVTLTGGVMSAASYLTTSDARLKENCTPVESSDLLFHLFEDYTIPPQLYKYTIKGTATTKYGYMAQDLLKYPVLSEIVEFKNGSYHVDYTQLICLLFDYILRK
jgi:hypothetical protein